METNFVFGYGGEYTDSSGRSHRDKTNYKLAQGTSPDEIFFFADPLVGRTRREKLRFWGSISLEKFPAISQINQKQIDKAYQRRVLYPTTLAPILISHEIQMIIPYLVDGEEPENFADVKKSLAKIDLLEKGDPDITADLERLRSDLTEIIRNGLGASA